MYVFHSREQNSCSLNSVITLRSRTVLLWLPLTLLHVGGGKRGGSDGGVGKNLKGGECWLRRNGASHSVICCTTYKRSWVWIGHERFENSGSVLGRYPAVSTASTVEVTQEAGVVPRHRCTVIGTPFQSPHRTPRLTVYIFCPSPTGEGGIHVYSSSNLSGHPLQKTSRALYVCRHNVDRIICEICSWR